MDIFTFVVVATLLSSASTSLVLLFVFRQIEPAALLAGIVGGVAFGVILKVALT